LGAESSVIGGGYYGPHRLCANDWSSRSRAAESAGTLDAVVAAWLWEASEELSRVRYEWPALLPSLSA